LIRLFKKKKKTIEATPPTEASCPIGMRIYAIGDVHGRADLLIELQDMIRRDAAGFDGRLKVVYLGDYIDRGLQSKQVVELLLEEQMPGFDSVFLKGNHEQAMLDFLDYPEATAGWLQFGGRETLISYGVTVTFAPLMKDMARLAEELDQVLPDTHREFLADGLLSWQAGSYYFVHAGVRPGVPLPDQHFEDQLWIRDEFIDSRADHGAVVVHGHTITPEVEFRDNRIGLDTGAFHSGVLSCLVLEGTERIVMPGLINGHSHAAMTLLRGVADDLALMDWLENYIFPAEVAFVDAEFVRIGTELACWEMLRGGTTTFVDMYYYPDAIAEVVESCGMRALISATVIDQRSPDAESAGDGLDKGVGFIERWQGRHPRITPIFGPHANYTLDAGQL